MTHRTAYIPQTEPGVGPADGSRFNGPACLPRGAAWPRCGECGSPMPLFLQLDLGDLPGVVGGKRETVSVTTGNCSGFS